MRLQSDLFDRFVAFAGRNLESASKPSLAPGSVLDTEQGEFMVMQVKQNSKDLDRADIVLRRVINGRVVND